MYIIILNNSKFYQIKDFYPLLKFPEKYKGTRPLTLRSSWEIKFVQNYLDINQSILEWTSETVIVKYLSPIDGKYHRYFIDFSLKALTKDGKTKNIWIEIKPYSQTQLPKEPKRKTKNYLESIKTYMVNQAKWETSKQICEQYKLQGKDTEFVVITEKDCEWFLK